MFVQHLGNTGLVVRRNARTQSGDPIAQDVVADDFAAEFGETDCGSHADVTRADDTDFAFHAFSKRLRWQR